MFCFKIVAVLGMHFCDPNQLIATKQRNKLAAANKALCYLTRGSFKEDQHTQASLTCVCLSLRLFVRTVWLEDCAQEEQRESEEEDAEAAIAEHEKDRSGLLGWVFRHCGVGTPIDPHDLLRSLRWTTVGVGPQPGYTRRLGKQ